MGLILSYTDLYFDPAIHAYRYKIVYPNGSLVCTGIKYENTKEKAIEAINRDLGLHNERQTSSKAAWKAFPLAKDYRAE